MPVYDPKTHILLGVTYELRSMYKPDKYYVSWTQLADDYFKNKVDNPRKP